VSRTRSAPPPADIAAVITANRDRLVREAIGAAIAMVDRAFERVLAAPRGRRRHAQFGRLR
jgi:hypothetical protein